MANASAPEEGLLPLCRFNRYAVSLSAQECLGVVRAIGAEWIVVERELVKPWASLAGSLV